MISKEKFSLKKRLQSFPYAINGIKLLISTEHNFRVHLTAVFCTILLGFLFHINTTEWIGIAIAITLVLVTETLNTSIEYLADIVSPGRHRGIKKVKDIAAAAVLISTACSITIGALIFTPKILNLL